MNVQFCNFSHVHVKLLIAHWFGVANVASIFCISYFFNFFFQCYNFMHFSFIILILQLYLLLQLFFNYNIKIEYQLAADQKLQKNKHNISNDCANFLILFTIFHYLLFEFHCIIIFLLFTFLLRPSVLWKVHDKSYVSNMFHRQSEYRSLVCPYICTNIYNITYMLKQIPKNCSDSRKMHSPPPANKRLKRQTC